MKGKSILIVVGIIVVIGIFFGSTYNSLATLDESVDGAWAQVENQLQRRADLIPNLVNTVQGYASHEQELLTDITNARAGIENATTPEEYAEANQEMDRVLGNLNVVVENYPNLKANENFLELQVQLEGTENRIAVERKRFNDAVQSYNSFIRKFPANIVANMNGFEKKSYFTAEAGANQAPKVEF